MNLVVRGNMFIKRYSFFFWFFVFRVYFFVIFELLYDNKIILGFLLVRYIYFFISENIFKVFFKYKVIVFMILFVVLLKRLLFVY